MCFSDLRSSEWKKPVGVKTTRETHNQSLCFSNRSIRRHSGWSVGVWWSLPGVLQRLPLLACKYTFQIVRAQANTMHETDRCPFTVCSFGQVFSQSVCYDRLAGTFVEVGLSDVEKQEAQEATGQEREQLLQWAKQFRLPNFLRWVSCFSFSVSVQSWVCGSSCRSAATLHHYGPWIEASSTPDEPVLLVHCILSALKRTSSARKEPGLQKCYFWVSLLKNPPPKNKRLGKRTIVDWWWQIAKKAQSFQEERNANLPWIMILASLSTTGSKQKVNIMDL